MKLRRTVYIISGPAGVGKSTTSKRLVHSLERSSYISGDTISHLPVVGRGKPWLCEDTNRLTWTNIASLTHNLLQADYNVVIDYVTFPHEAAWLANELKNKEVQIVYIILLTDQETLGARDRLRPAEEQMGERSFILLQEFKAAIQDTQHVLYTSHLSVDDIDKVVQEIRHNKQYIIREKQAVFGRMEEK
ncbi:AAA family ATPase [Paenibacillus sp. GCM10028914]|uniref:AAA family ATPase n=1 Tax=Paenibacillus sp. GCM10028914 TaxID=3273416 RepID=UPI00361DBC46